jgi:argininosuccinate lyase
MYRFAADYRTAHRVVQHAVRSGAPLDAGAVARASAAVTGAEWQLGDDELKAMLEPRALVASRTALGGAAPEAMDQMLVRIRRHAEGLCAELDARRAAITDAEDRLRARAVALAGRGEPG